MIRHAELENVVGTVSRETFDLLVEFERLFLQWNKTSNLIAPSTVPVFWTRHVIDSAQLYPIAGSFRTWTDLGSGGGLPGIVIAIFGRHTGARVSLVESNQKKAAFLRRCAAELGLPVDVHVERIETLESGSRDIISARALAPLTVLFALTDGWFGPQTRALLHKGQDFQREVSEARDQWDFDLLEHVSVVDPLSRVLEVSNVKRLER